ncbi:MAG: hypothetical protein Fur0010_20880 [Bdellovibrio sp.]
MKVKLMVTMLVLAGTNGAMAKNKVIYGEDNRVNASESTNELYKKLAQSTAAMIPNEAVTPVMEGVLSKINGATLKESQRLCEGERFEGQQTAGMCSGFLVGPNLLVTAGHCMPSTEDANGNLVSSSCQGNKWVFDYRQDLLGDDTKEVFVNSSNVYSCKRVLGQKLSRTSMNDYAIIELDREVTGREPLKYRTEGKIADGTELVVIGHPSGLPTIIADGAQVRTNDNPFFFQANLDTFGGNSGSAVFDAETGVVEGILVRGEKDYKYDEVNNCYRVFQCENDKCRGEDVTRITMIPQLAPGQQPEEPAEPETPSFPFPFPYIFATPNAVVQ